MNDKEYHEQYTKNCQKCRSWLMCKPHQNLWVEKVDSTSVPSKYPKQDKVWTVVNKGRLPRYPKGT